MLLAVFLSCFVLAYYLASHAQAMGLLAHPGDHRQHEEATPVVGGIAIFAGFLTAYLILDNTALGQLMPSLFLLCVVGVLDDRFKLPYGVRFLAQAVAAVLMIWLTGVQLVSLGALVSDTELLLGRWSLPLTVFAIIGVINALNMSDGIDGLAASLVLVVLAGLFIAGSEQHGLLAISASAVSGFLFWNIRILRPRARIFMGDAGSTMLGLLLAYFLIELTQNPASTIPPVTALWFLLLPLMDAVGVLLVRPLQGKSPFAADRMHYHHVLQNFGFSVNQTLIVALLVQAIFIVNGLLANRLQIPENIQFFLFILLFTGYVFVLYRVSAQANKKG